MHHVPTRKPKHGTTKKNNMCPSTKIQPMTFPGYRWDVQNTELQSGHFLVSETYASVIKNRFCDVEGKFSSKYSLGDPGADSGTKETRKGRKTEVSEEKAPRANGKAPGDNVSPDQFQTA